MQQESGACAGAPRVATIMAALALLGAWTSAAAAEAEGATSSRGHHYHYFDQATPLALDVRRVAVLVADDAAGPAGGAQQDDAKPGSERLGRWALVDVPEPMRTAEGAERLVRDLAGARKDDGGVFVSPVFFDDFGGPLIVTPDVLVRFHESVPPMLAEFILEGLGLDVERDVLDREWAGMSGAYRVRPQTTNGLDVLDLANTLARRPETIFAEPDLLCTAEPGEVGPPGSGVLGGVPNDPFFSRLWGLRNIGQSIGSPCNVGAGTAGMDMRALDAWQITTGDPGVIVVVLDDGVQLDHPDLLIDASLGKDFTPDNGGGWPMHACDRHGTPVAGGIAALMNNGVGVVGIAPGSRVASARISNPGSASCTPWIVQSSWVVNALGWAEQIGAAVTNTSWSFGSHSSAIANKYASSRANGIVHFACAGNDNTTNIWFPANLPSVNAVGAINRFGQKAWFSNWGQGLAFVAPGEHIVSTDRTGPAGYSSGDYTCFGGTSAASPYAAGVAALVLSVNAALDVDDVELLMQVSATDLGAPGYDTTFGWGLVNAHAAVASATITNDACGSAIAVGDGVTTFSNMFAQTTGPVEPAHCNMFGDSHIQNDVWFTYTATCSGTVTIDLCASSYLAKLGVYGDSCPAGPGEVLACDVVSCPTANRPYLTLPVTAGETLTLRIGGHNGARGDGAMLITCQEGVPCPADLNGDDNVDVLDLLILLDAWGPCPGCGEDLSGDGNVDVLDLLILLDAWGPCA